MNETVNIEKNGKRVQIAVAATSQSCDFFSIFILGLLDILVVIFFHCICFCFFIINFSALGLSDFTFWGHFFFGRIVKVFFVCFYYWGEALC